MGKKIAFFITAFAILVSTIPAEAQQAGRVEKAADQCDDRCENGLVELVGDSDPFRVRLEEESNTTPIRHVESSQFVGKGKFDVTSERLQNRPE